MMATFELIIAEIEIRDGFPVGIPIPEDAVITLGQENQMDVVHTFTDFMKFKDDGVAKYHDMHREYVINSCYE